MVAMPNRVRVVVVVSALALAVGLLTLALLAKPAQAQTQRERVPVEFDFLNPCTGETILFRGTVQVFFEEKQDANGGSHFQVHAHLHGQGVGLTSGDKYVLNETQNNHQNFRVPSESGAANFHITQSLRVIRQGQDMLGDDFQSEFLLHLTINANGDVTADVVRTESQCF
jgi:hypothetical protein